MDNELSKIIKSFKNLKQYKDLGEEEIKIKAEEELAKRSIVNNLTFCSNDEEKEYAKNLLERYLEQCSFENEADKDTLKQLIDLEILSERVKQNLNTEYNKANPAIPTQMIEHLQSLNDQILNFKEKLGLTQKDKQQVDWYKDWDNLKKKAIKYYQEHKGCNIVKCPYCQKLFYLLLRTENLTPEKANLFKGTILYNKELFRLYEEKRITEEEIANILGVSKYYIDYIYNLLYLKEKEK